MSCLLMRRSYSERKDKRTYALPALLWCTSECIKAAQAEMHKMYVITSILANILGGYVPRYWRCATVPSPDLTPSRSGPPIAQSGRVDLHAILGPEYIAETGLKTACTVRWFWTTTANLRRHRHSKWLKHMSCKECWSWRTKHRNTLTEGDSVRFLDEFQALSMKKSSNYYSEQVAAEPTSFFLWVRHWCFLHRLWSNNFVLVFERWRLNCDVGDMFEYFDNGYIAESLGNR